MENVMDGCVVVLGILIMAYPYFFLEIKLNLEQKMIYLIRIYYNNYNCKYASVQFD